MAHLFHPLVELANAWNAFEQEHPGRSTEEFCRYFLLQKDRDRLREAGQSDPPKVRKADMLVVAIDRLNKYKQFYFKKVMQDQELDHGEDFLYLLTLYTLGPHRKSDLIHYQVSEFPSGIHIINRLLRQGFIQEADDPEDARSKQVKVTPQGASVLREVVASIMQIDDLLLGGLLSEEEQELALRLLQKVEQFHTQHYVRFRNQSKEELLSRLLGKPPQ